MDIIHLVKESLEILESEFMIKPEASKYYIYSKDKWETFLSQTRSDRRCMGVYFPLSLSAHLDETSEFLQVNLFHEFFGHGLFCEHSLIGRKIVSLERDLAESEDKALNLEEKAQEDERRVISVGNPYFEECLKKRQRLIDLMNNQMDSYEGFALWLESFLAYRTGLEDLFERKFEEVIHLTSRELLSKLISFQNQYGNFALFCQLDFQKRYTLETIRGLVEKIYRGSLQTVSLCMLYGSRKPESDIDLFIVSEKNSGNFFNGWLDIYQINIEELSDLVEKLDISITDPLFSGEMVIDYGLLNSLQSKTLALPITQEVIAYNLRRSDEQGRFASSFPEDSRERRIALSYQESFKRNAELLSKGYKALTLKRLKR